MRHTGSIIAPCPDSGEWRAVQPAAPHPNPQCDTGINDCQHAYGNDVRSSAQAGPAMPSASRAAEDSSRTLGMSLGCLTCHNKRAARPRHRFGSACHIAVSASHPPHHAQSHSVCVARMTDGAWLLNDILLSSTVLVGALPSAACLYNKNRQSNTLSNTSRITPARNYLARCVCQYPQHFQIIDHRYDWYHLQADHSGDVPSPMLVQLTSLEVFLTKHAAS